jgi:hypothetical protein
MVDEPKLSAIERMLAECTDSLRRAAAGPAARELRVRLGALTRVVGGWKSNPPHPAQLVAMLDCAAELRTLAARAGAASMPTPPSIEAPFIVSPRSRTPSARTTARMRRPVGASRPPPRDATAKTLRPPQRRRSTGS